ncbi:MAG: signal recognition particle receptor subunit alpha [Alkalibacterium sp.]|nr:signal recognition particle receptor subunit alpha [Alkalibacterium sp.]
MPFEGLTGRLQDAFSARRKKGKVTEQDVKDVMREVRLALLEADVNYKVVERDFVKTVREKSLGEEVLGSLNGGQQVVKIVNDELTELMGGEQVEDHLRRAGSGSDRLHDDRSAGCRKPPLPASWPLPAQA